MNYELCERSLEYMIIAFKGPAELADSAGKHHSSRSNSNVLYFVQVYDQNFHGGRGG